MVGALCLKLTKQVNKYPNSSVNLPYFGTYQSLTLFLSRNQYQVFVFILQLSFDELWIHIEELYVMCVLRKFIDAKFNGNGSISLNS